MRSPDYALALLTLGIGVLMARTSLCSVACLRELIVEHRPDGMLRLTIAASAAGLVLLSLAAWSPAGIRLPLDPPVMRAAVVGGLLLGIGAVVNGACYLGTVVYLARGRLAFLLTLLSLMLALRFSPMPMRVADADATRMGMGREALVGLSICALVFILACVAVRRAAQRGSGRPQSIVSAAIAAAAIGGVAGCVYAGHPNWNYTSVLSAVAHLDRQPVPWSAHLAALALLTGAATSSAIAGRFQPQRPSAVQAVRCLAGGAIMGIGALRIPGGHDLLLLWSVPGLARSAAAAFATMALAVAALLWIGRIVGHVTERTDICFYIR